MQQTFSMPPEPEAWKHSIVMWALVLVGAVAVVKMFVDAVRAARGGLGTSVGLAVASLVLLGSLVAMLRLEAPLMSRSAFQQSTGVIIVVTLWMMNLGVTLFSSMSEFRATRIAWCVAGLLLATFVLAMSTARLSGARVVAHHMQCRVNARAIGVGLLELADERGELPPPVILNDDVPRSWRVELLPWLDQQGLRAKYQDDRPWDHAETNARVGRTSCPAYRCPCSNAPVDERGFAVTDYAAVVGPQSVWSEKNRASFPNVADGQGTTVLIVEASGLKIPWTEPRDADARKLPPGVNRNGQVRGGSDGIASGYHGGGCNVVFADGAVRFVSQNIDPQVLSKLLTADGGETTVGDEF